VLTETAIKSVAEIEANMAKTQEVK
jgi:hypothetical protein